MKYPISAVLGLILFNSCATSPQKKFDHLIKEHKCDEAALNIPSMEFKNVMTKAQSYSGAVASYAVSGAAYGADALLYIVGGVVVPAVACGTMAAASVSNGVIAQTSSAFEVCARNVQELTASTDVLNKGLGSQTFKSTSNWRCSDVYHLSGFLDKISDCHASSGDKEKARTQLLSMKKFKEEENCLDEESSDDIQKKIDALKVQSI